MLKRTIYLAIIASMAIAGCSPKSEDDKEAKTSQSSVEPVSDSNAKTAESESIVQLNQLYLDYQKDFLQLNPISAIFRGNMNFNDKFGDYLSAEYFAESKQLDETYLKRLIAVDPQWLTGSDRVSYDIFEYNRKQALESYANGSAEFSAMMPINQIFSLPQYLPMLGSGQMAQPFKTVKDYEDWISRAKGFNAYVEQSIIRMQQGVESGVIMPTLLMAKTLPQLQGMVMVDIEQSPFYMPIKNMPETFTEQEKTKLVESYKVLIKDHLQVGYQKLHDYIKNDYMKHTRETHGIGALPNGAVAYKQSIRQMTTTDMDADTIHEIGLKEANRLYGEMKKVKERVGFDGDMKSFFKFLKDDPQFYYSKKEDLMQGYEDLRSVINPKLDSIFNIKPKADYILKAIEPFRERSMAAAQYSGGSPDGVRPGIFWVNTFDLTARPKWMMEALSIHEASPGHHFQISINQEAGELPPFRRFGGYSSYSEGWGLYSETLGVEMGLYTDPYQYFGMLYAQIWRANRLVVDTGIHSKGWTREQAIEFMQSNSPAADNDVIAEVERYMAAPGQALSYMIGRMKIQELRERAEKSLGEKFDLKEFHREVLADGAMPLAILEQKIDRWIAKIKG